MDLLTLDILVKDMEKLPAVIVCLKLNRRFQPRIVPTGYK